MDKPKRKRAQTRVDANNPIEPDWMSVAELTQWHLDRYVRLTFRLARKLAAHRQFETARQLMERVIVVTSDKPEDLARYLLLLGQLDEELYHYEDAAAAYRRAVMVEPTDRRTWYDAHYALGCSLIQMARYREGETFLREAIRIDPLQHIAYRELGAALEATGEYAEAAKIYIDAALLHPRDRGSLKYLRKLVDENEIVRIQLPEIHTALAWCKIVAKEHTAQRQKAGKIPSPADGSEAIPSDTGPVSTGGDGSSLKNAVVINASTTVAGIRTEYEYIGSVCGERDIDYTVDKQTYTDHNGRDYDIIDVRLVNGEKHSFYFDITSFFGKW